MLAFRISSVRSGIYFKGYTPKLGAYVLNGCMEKIYLGVFNGCSALTDVEISSDIKVLGNSCFKSCTALKEIHLEQIQPIERDAFKNCSNLQKVYISADCKIDKSAFNGCDQLEFIYS